MKKNTLIWLMAAAVVAAAVAWFVSDARAPALGPDGKSTLLVPALPDALNDVTRIAVVAADGTPAVTLTRGDTAWQVDERGGYPADTGKVRKYLLDLADARLVEAKTSREDNYPTLGVVAPGEPGASGMQIALEGVTGTPTFVVGNAARGGSYVRRNDEAQSWLTSIDVSVDTDPAEWLDRDIMDIGSADIVAVEIRHPDGEVVAARRGEVNLQLTELPDGKVPTGPAAVNPLAGVLSGLRLDDVQPAGAFDDGELEPVIGRWTTRDGVIVEVTLYERDDARFARFDVQVAAAGEGGDAQAPDSATDSATDATAATDGADGGPDAGRLVQQLAARTSGWVYRLPAARYQQMTRRADAFLQDAESD